MCTTFTTSTALCRRRDCERKHFYLQIQLTYSKSVGCVEKNWFLRPPDSPLQPMASTFSTSEILLTPGYIMAILMVDRSQLRASLWWATPFILLGAFLLQVWNWLPCSSNLLNIKPFAELGKLLLVNPHCFEIDAIQDWLALNCLSWHCWYWRKRTVLSKWLSLRNISRLILLHPAFLK